MIQEFKIQDNLGFRVSFACWCILIIGFKEIDLVLYPRLWAEEGAIFYAFAAHHSIWEILTTPHVGYFALFNSIISVLQAKVFPPEAAAWVSTVAGFIVQFIPLLIVLFGNHPFWDKPFKKAIVCCIIIIIMPPELWLNTTNSHFVFGLITFLILVTPVGSLSGLQRWSFRALLMLGTMSDPISLFLTPLFLVKWHFELRQEQGVQAVIQLSCAVIQSAVILYSLLYDNAYSRLHFHDWLLTVQGFLIDHFNMNLVMFGRDARLVIGGIMAAYFIYLLVERRGAGERFYFLAGFIIIAVISTLGSLMMMGSPRYGYVPSCILMTILFAEACSSRLRNPRRMIVIMIFIFAFTVNGIYYKSRMSECYSSVYPKWKEEVVKWRVDKDYHPIIHPVYGTNTPWYINL